MDRILDTPIAIYEQIQAELEPLNSLADRLTNVPEIKSVLQKLFEETVPIPAIGNYDALSRVVMRMSFDLPPYPEREPSIQEFKGSLSHLVKHKVSVDDIVDAGNDE